MQEQQPQLDDQDWLDRIWNFTKRRPIIWGPLILVVVVATIAILGSQSAAQPIGTDPIRANQPLSNPEQHLHSLAIDPHDPGTIYLGSHYGLFTSTDDGKTWPEPRGRYNTLMIISLSVQPLTGDVAFIGQDANGGDFGQNGVYCSADGGKSFARAPDPSGVPSPPTRYAIVPGFAAHQWLATYAGAGLYATNDDCQSWTRIYPLVHSDALRTVLALPQSHRLLIGGTFGLKTSIDNGANWATVTSVQGGVWAMVVSPADPRVVYLTADGGIYRSTDGGATFTMISVNVTTAPFPRLAASSQHADTVYALGGQQQVWVTTDGGRDWSLRSTLTLANPQNIFVAPNNDQHIYVGFFTPATVVASMDGGTSWTAIAH